MASEPPAVGPGRGLRGSSGALSGSELVGCLERLGCTGTLLVGPWAAPRVLLLVEGQIRQRRELGASPGPGAGLEDPEQPFFFQTHEASDLPRLLSRFPESGLSELRALPDLGAGLRLGAAVLDLQALLSELAEEDFHGCLALEGQDARGVVMLQGGRIATAVYESALHRRSGPDALRAVLGLSRTDKGVKLELLPLPLALMAGLLGLSFDQRLGRSPADFSGLEVDEAGYTYFQGGQAWLRLAVMPAGTPGRYSPCLSFPALSLPSELPGWESLRYRLTLRGRDALNPMTELSMQFRGNYGRAGGQILEGLTRAASVEEAAHRLGLELAEVKPWVERLEREGLIREAEADAGPPA